MRKTGIAKMEKCTLIGAIITAARTHTHTHPTSNRTFNMRLHLPHSKRMAHKIIHTQKCRSYKVAQLSIYRNIRDDEQCTRFFLGQISPMPITFYKESFFFSSFARIMNNYHLGYISIWFRFWFWFDLVG